MMMWEKILKEYKLTISSNIEFNKQKPLILLERVAIALQDAIYERAKKKK